jgi:Bacterial Ig-like domain
MKISFKPILLLIALTSSLIACGDTAPPKPAITAVTVNAAKTSLASTETTALAATVTGTGAFSNDVTWSIKGGGGKLSTTTGSSVNFTAPSLAAASETIVKVTSTQDISKFAEITLTIAANPVTPPTVTISNPSVDVFTKGTVNIQVVVTGAPESVDLLKDGKVLATLLMPYSYSWDTSTEPEKAYSITAKAIKAGTADVTSAAKQVTVDRTAPTLVSRVPVNGAVNVFLADEISATLSEPILTSSVNTTNAQLKIGTNVVTSTATLDTAGTKLVLKPTLLPALTATITVALNGLTDRAGNALNVPNSSFNAPDWQAPGSVQALNSATSGVPKIAIDSNGKPVVAWTEAGNINVKKWNGTSWDLLATTPGGVGSMALDSAGNPIVSWNQYICCSSEYKYDTFVKKWDGAAWVQLGAALDIHANVIFANGQTTTSAIAIDSTDNPIVTWSEWDETTSYNIYTKRWNGVSWIQLGTLLDENTDKSARMPAIAINSSGQPIVTWIESDDTTDNVYAKRWNGTAWVQYGTTLDFDLTNNVLFPAIAIDSSANPIVTWCEYNAASYNIYAKKWNGSSWTTLGTSLVYDSTKISYNSSIAIDSSNNPIVAWDESDNGFDVHVKKWNGSNWTALGASLDNDPSKPASNPSIAIDSSNNPIVTWNENNTDIYVKRFNRIP